QPVLRPHPFPRPSEGERVAEGRVRGCSWLRCAILESWKPMNRVGCGSQTRGPDRASVRRSGSWSQCMRKNERGLPMNRPLVLLVLDPPLGFEDEDEHENDWVHGTNARFWNRGSTPLDRFERGFLHWNSFETAS